MTKILNIIFFGSSEFSVYVLKKFLKKYKPILVLTLEGKQKGRGLKIEPNIVYNFCLKEKLNVIELTQTNMNRTVKQSTLSDSKPGYILVQNHTQTNVEKKDIWAEFKENIQQIKPECGVIAGFGKIIPQEIINLFPKGILNVHPSLLPKYRGPNPIREVILQGEKETGTTLFLIDNLVDHGPIIKQEKIELQGNETYIELEEKLGKLGGEILNSIIEEYLKCELIRTEIGPTRTEQCNIQLIYQDDSLASFTKKITKKDGLLSFEESYEIWQRKIRALNPWPGTYIYIPRINANKNTRINADKKDIYVNPHDINPRESALLKIFKIKKLDEKNLSREILKKNIKEFFEIKNNLGLRLKDAFIILEEVQLEGRKKMSGKEFLNGFRKILI